MHTIGIVGHGKDKFTEKSARIARKLIITIINNAINEYGQHNIAISSGHSPMGGIDIWTEQIAEELHVQTRIYPSTTNQWDGPGGYKERNLKIAEADEVHVVLVDKYPPNYNGRRFEGCYHCDKHHKEHIVKHVKSGGCWTGWKAFDRGAEVFFHIILQEEPK